MVNCYKSKDALEEAINNLENGEWVLVVIEPPTKALEDVVCDPGIKLFSGTHSRNISILTNMLEWKESLITPDHDCIIIQANLMKQKVNIAGIYYNPEVTLADFRTRVKNLHEQLVRVKGQRIFVTGDVNCRSPIWSNEEVDRKGTILMNACCLLYTSPSPRDS